MREKGVFMVVSKKFHAKIEEARKEYSKYIPIKGTRQLTDLWANSPNFKIPSLNMKRRRR